MKSADGRMTNNPEAGLFGVKLTINALRADVARRKRGSVTLPRFADYTTEWNPGHMGVCSYLSGENSGHMEHFERW